MEPAPSRRRLIVNADDFGLSHSTNAAIIQAHRDGVLTTASLMVNEAGFDQAVALARDHARLGVGLHLTLVCGHSASPRSDIPHLINDRKEFTSNPLRAGFSYVLGRSVRNQLEAEISAQLDKFRQTGLPLDHLNGHLHLHLHPVVSGILLRNAGRWGIRRMRLTRDSLRLDAALARGRWFYRISHAAIFGLLSHRARIGMSRNSIRHTSRVFGLLQNGRVDEEYVVRLLNRLPAGDSELYSHPSLDEFRHELDALISPRVKALIRELGIALIRYQDL